MPDSLRRERKTALITGGSSGIGFELAKCFAQDGYHLVLVARNQEALLYAAGQLREAFNVPVTVIANDLSRPGAPEALIAELRQRELQVDGLINNAGFGVYGLFAQCDQAAQLEMLHVNMVSLTHLTRLLLPRMLECRAGKILNVASTAAFQPGPLMAVYYASKAYVLSFSEALANELRGTGVSVTALCPGPTPTGFQRRSGMQSSRLMRGHLLDAAAVARIGYRGLLRGRTVVIPGVRNRLLALLVRLLPRDAVTQIVRGIQDVREPVAMSSVGTHEKEVRHDP